MNSRGRVHVIDDDDDVRDALGSLLRAEHFLVFLHKNSSDFRLEYDGSIPSCLLLDIRLDQEDGLDVQEQLTSDGLFLPVIIMTGHGDIPSAVRSMKQGAVDFLSKPFSDDVLLETLDAALQEDRGRISEHQTRRSIEAGYQSLTTRERDVASLAAEGLMNKEIAARLGIELVTVKVHRGKVMRKMMARSLVELVRMLNTLDTSRP